MYNIIIAVCLYIFVKISLEFFNIFYFNESKQYYTFIPIINHHNIIFLILLIIKIPYIH